MTFSDGEIDKIVFHVLLDCRCVTPPLDRNEIARHVADHFSLAIHKQVSAALERLVRQGVVLDDRGEGGLPIRYRLPPDERAQH